MIEKINDFNLNFEDSKELIVLFGDKAEELAKRLNDGSKEPDIHTTQFRQFYEKILELNDKSQGLSEDEFQIKILPFVKLLNSKVQYSKARKNCGEVFEKLMSQSIKAVNSEIELRNFKYFLEAIIGYMPKK